jgi:MFS transporter, DHA1 family, tetracycline resistance protein
MNEPQANYKPPTASRAALLTVFLVVFIDLLGFGIVLPLMPLIAKSYLPAAGVPEQLKGITIGSLMAVFSLMQFVFAPIWGRLSDRVGRKPILILGLAGSVVFYTLFGYASSLPISEAQLALILMFVSRIGAGLAGATIATAQAVIADCTPPEKRAHGMALIGAAFGIGFTFGPIIGGVGEQIVPNHLEFAGYAAAVLSLVAWSIGIWKMPETRRPGVLSTRRNWLDLHGLFSTLKSPIVGVLVLTFFLATFGFAIFESTLALYTHDALNYATENVFWIFAYVGFVLMFTQGYLYRKLKNKYHEVTLIRLGVGFMFLGLAGLATVAIGNELPLRHTGFFVALALGVVGFAFMTPSIQALISRRSDPNRQGEVLGVNQSFSALARILGPAIGPVLFYADSSYVLPYVVSAVLLGLVLLLLTKVRHE